MPLATRRTVYPHVCGGILDREGQNTPLVGLSPRVRGHPLIDLPISGYMGSIPTCAGASLTRHLALQLEEVYPHVCGGIPTSLKDEVQMRGLSPRVRGHHARHHEVVAARRSIPTCAGASSGANVKASASKVYPHVCGGIQLPAGRARDGRGLSPRVRGHLSDPGAAFGSAGSIPTCAGASMPFRRSRRRDRVYPHVCGGI